MSRIENGKTGLKRAQQSVLPLWERTRRFRTYSPWIIPGAVQTPSYTRAVLRSFMHRRNLPDDIEDAVKVRTDRLRLLHEGDHTFAVLIEEPVLRNVIGDTDVMAGQLGHPRKRPVLSEYCGLTAEGGATLLVECPERRSRSRTGYGDHSTAILSPE
ncbi:Scr1 family TA system antitoxin-like transcriptional regulator [Kribbella sp. NPDC048928]|uniref:Scr1 family TA system antitoxin-like transcriptional regulator n=1 Tax=Kribbella sp. NPDC048928 TaxID=3364111 RepID=UPI00371D780C